MLNGPAARRDLAPRLIMQNPRQHSKKSRTAWTSHSCFEALCGCRAAGVCRGMSRSRLCWILLVCLSWMSIPTTMASPDVAPLSSEYVLRTWQTDDGLPQNTVTGIAQTPDGYLWLATQGGLARFDGLR